MLVIRRHPGQAVQIGDEIEIVVIDCGNGRVKLGIRAPKEVAVMRAEVRRTRDQNLAAAGAIAHSPLELSIAVPQAVSFLPDPLP